MSTESLLNSDMGQPCFLCRSSLDNHKVYKEAFKIGYLKSGGEDDEDNSLSYSMPAFIVRILLEIPEVKLKDQLINEVSLVTCDSCSKAIQQAGKIYHEIVEITRAFRTVQKRVVEIFKTRCGSPGDPEDQTGGKEDEDLFYQQCEQFVNENSFNCFELPFTVRDVVKIRPVVPKSPSISESPPDVKIEVDEDDNQQQILLFLSGEDPNNDLIETSIKEEQLSDYDDNDNGTDDNSGGSSSSQSTDSGDAPVKNKKRRIQRSRLKPNTKAQQSPISKFDKLYPNYPHKLVARPSDCKFLCPEHPCQKCFKDKATLQRHILVTHLGNLLKCTWPNCTRTFTKSVNFESHLDRHKGTPRWKCEENPEVCNESFYARNQLYAHKQIKHQSTNQNPLVCEACGKSFNCRDRLYTHRSTKHRNSTPTTTRGRDADPDLGRKSNFELRHPNYILTKDPNGKFSCPEINCKKIHRLKRDMEDHIQTVHMNEKLYICEWPNCDKSFETYNSLKCHQAFHRKVGRKCSTSETCTKNEAGSSKVQTGRPKKEAMKSKSLICDHCGKSFYNNSNLKSHVNLFHKKTEGDFECHLCVYKFVSDKNLKLHLFRTHKFSKDGFTPRKPERKEGTQCPVQGCRLAFFKAEGLKKHLEKKHGGDGEGIVTQFICKYCGKGFHLKCKLDHHHEIHENEKTKPYKCEVCGKGFATMAYLKYHQKHTHKMKLEDERLGRLTKD